jgi:hypothetical protein
MKSKGACCQRRDSKPCSVHYKKFDLVDIENMAFNKLYVAPPSNQDLSTLLNNDMLRAA